MASLNIPLYIGMSDNSIRDRFDEHCSSPNEKLSEAFRAYRPATLRFWFSEQDPYSVKEIEDHLLMCFDPPANTKKPALSGTLGAPVDA